MYYIMYSMRLIVILLFTFFSLLTPFTLNSADIFISSEGSIKVSANLNPRIIPGNSKLGSSIFIVSTPINTPSIRLDIPSCEHTEELLYTGTGKNLTRISVIEARFSDICTAKSARIASEEYVFTDTEFALPISHESDILSELMDLDTSDLTLVMRDDFANAQLLNSQIASYSGSNIATKLQHIQDLYREALLTTRSDLARSLLDDRENMSKYISPVAGYSLPIDPVSTPGANRGYRKDTTDGVHHGWDIMAPYGTPVRALAKGIIVRVISDWGWADFDRIKKNHLNDDDRLENLNIYRGNQVWLKTMDGNVTFYSHLSKINPEITVGSMVTPGQILGAIGSSGVPEKNYKNIHLHFEVQKNPHIQETSPSTFLDIMRWNYIGKNESRNLVEQETRVLFQ